MKLCNQMYQYNIKNQVNIIVQPLKERKKFNVPSQIKYSQNLEIQKPKTLWTNNRRSYTQRRKKVKQLKKHENLELQITGENLRIYNFR